MADTKINFYVLTFLFALKQNGRQNKKFRYIIVQNAYYILKHDILKTHLVYLTLA